MAFQIESIPDEKKPSRQLKKQHREATRGALQEVGDTWTRDIAPKHFTQQGAKEYGYKPRTKRYIRRKIREGRGNAPLIYTGDSKKAVEETTFKPVKDRESAVQVARGTIRAKKLNFRPGGINMREEVTAVSSADIAVLKGVFEREFNERFEKR